MTTIDTNGAMHDAEGRFAHNPHATPAYDLTLDDATYNSRGSAAFPPASRSAAQHIAFWNTVEIPDWMLKSARDTYTPWQIEQLRLTADEAAKQLRRDNAGKTLVNGKTWKTAISDVVDKTFEEAEAATYPDMQRQYTRDIVRGCLMWYYAGDLPQEEREYIAKHKVNVGRQVFTSEALVARYHFGIWQDSITG